MTAEFIAWGLVKNKPFTSYFWKSHRCRTPKIYAIEKIFLRKWHWSREKSHL